MGIINIIVIGLGLAMDALAVSITSGLTVRRVRIRYALKLALSFAGFQALMPVIGWLVGMRTLVVLAIATSIDALAVGVSFSCADVNRVSILLLDAGAIGAITFLLCFPGVYIGRRFGAAFRGKAGVIGGILLIGMGVKIFVERCIAG